jgi:hypothetical protein
VRTSKLLLSDIGLFTGVSLDKSPGDSLLFKQSALRGVSYALTVLPVIETIFGPVSVYLKIATQLPAARSSQLFLPRDCKEGLLVQKEELV